jgi:transposase
MFIPNVGGPKIPQSKSADLDALLRDELGTLYRDEDFSALFPPCGQAALSPWLLALVTILQFRENLSDRQAAEAVRARIDWKYRAAKCYPYMPRRLAL